VEKTENSTIAGKAAYTLIGTYDLPSSGLQKGLPSGILTYLPPLYCIENNHHHFSTVRHH